MTGTVFFYVIVIMIVNMIVIMIMIMNMININLINHVQNLYLLFAYSAYFLPNVFSNNKI